MAGRFDGQRALVTGGAAGIGRAVVLALVEEGCRVAIADVNAEGGAETVETIKASGGQALFVQMDVSQSDQVEAGIGQVVASWGGLDLAFNNAGILGELAARTSQCTEKNWDQVLGINLKGTWLCLKHEIATMRKNGGGAIVNASSAAALGGGFISTAYVASKHGVVGLTKSAAVECAKENIRVNAVCPGYIQTTMFGRVIREGSGLHKRLTERAPMGRLGSPEEVAGGVLWLLSEEARFVTGHILGIDGGMGAL